MNEHRMQSWISRILNDVSKHKPVALRKLSNKMAQFAFLNNDKMLAKLSVISYALSKYISKPHVINSDQWRFLNRTLRIQLRRAKYYASKGDYESFSKEIDEIESKIEMFDNRMGNYLHNLIEKAKVKQASRVYGMGSSLRSAKQLFDVKGSEIIMYVGQTKIHDRIDQKNTLIQKTKELEAILA